MTTGERLNINKERLYENYQQMAQMESEREDGIHFVSIVVQNYIHYDVAKVFLQAGIHVVCEKPLCFEIEQAKELKQIAEEKKSFIYGDLFLFRLSYG